MSDAINSDETPYSEPTAEAFEVLHSHSHSLETIAVDESPGLSFKQLTKMCRDVRAGYKRFLADRGMVERHGMKTAIAGQTRVAVAERELKRKQDFREAVAKRRKNTTNKK